MPANRRPLLSRTPSDGQSCEKLRWRVTAPGATDSRAPSACRRQCSRLSASSCGSQVRPEGHQDVPLVRTVVPRQVRDRRRAAREHPLRVLDEEVGPGEHGMRVRVHHRRPGNRVAAAMCAQQGLGPLRLGPAVVLGQHDHRRRRRANAGGAGLARQLEVTDAHRTKAAERARHAGRLRLAHRGLRPDEDDLEFAAHRLRAQAVQGARDGRERVRRDDDGGNGCHVRLGEGGSGGSGCCFVPYPADRLNAGASHRRLAASM